jgi:DNA-binding NarL/FixJ family response regulator
VSRPIRLFLADDHPIVLAGLRNLVQSEPDVELVGEATTGWAAVKAIRESKPDVAVLDISMPELNGILVARRVAEECPNVRILILTFHEDRAYVHQALQAGVRGYVLKRTAAETLLHAIRAVYVGGLYVDPSIAGRIFDSKEARGTRTFDGGTPISLTDRESEVLKLAALGFTNKEIAGRLGIGIKSVETYKSRGSEKLGLRTRADIVRFASAEGWLTDF